MGGEWTDSSSPHKSKLSPFKFFLSPLQNLLTVITGPARIIEKIIKWDLHSISFFVTATCFLLSITFLILPWEYLLRWYLRYVVCICFGPSLKLVDIYSVTKE